MKIARAASAATLIHRRLQTLPSAAVFGGLVLAAFVIRVIFIIGLGPLLEAGQPLSLDASAYHEIAQNLVERLIFTSAVDPPYDPQQPGTFRPPLTPFYLAFWYTLFGVNLLWGRCGLALLSAVSCGLTYWLGEQFLGRTTGVLAGLLSSVYPLFLLLVHLPLTETLSMFFTVLLLTGLYAANPSAASPAAYGRSLLIGGVFGLLLLNKAANIVLLPCIVVWAVRGPAAKHSRRVTHLLLVLLAAALLLLPWTIRNYQVTDTLIPVNSNGGWTFYLGNNPHTAENLTALEHGTSNGWIPPKAVYTPFADLRFEQTRAWESRALRLGVRFIRTHPAQFLTLAYRKMKIFWSPYHHIVDQLSWYPLAVSSLIGVVAARSRWRQHLLAYLAILTTMAIPVFFTSMPRFRAPIMPLIMIYGALGLLTIKQQLARTVGRSHADRN